MEFFIIPLPNEVGGGLGGYTGFTLLDQVILFICVVSNYKPNQCCHIINEIIRNKAN